MSIDRLEVSTWGWGKGEESYFIDHVVLYGDPHQAEVWKQLEIVINQHYEHENGKSLVPVITAVDSGGLHTSEVYQLQRKSSTGCYCNKRTITGKQTGYW